VLAPPLDKVRDLQRTLYRAARADPGRRFHALYDKVHRRDVLERAWGQVRRNRGAAGMDQVTLADVERYGVDRLLGELATDLRDGTYRPQAARRVWIPKFGSDERRPLSIPAVADRIVQTATKIVIEPIFEADFLACSFGFRPRKTPHDALQVLLDETWNNRRWIVETDIASCFEAIPHDGLMSAVEERICDRELLKLVRGMLRAGVMEHGSVRHRVTGTPQGGVISPLLANVYLHRLDRRWQTRGCGRLVRYADDLGCGVHQPSAGRQRVAAADGLSGRSGAGAQGCQDTHRAPARRWAGPGLPRLSPPDGARQHASLAALCVPRPLALTQGHAARQGPQEVVGAVEPARVAVRHPLRHDTAWDHCQV